MSDKPAGAVKRRPHNPKTFKRLPWSVCSHCSLAYLKNEATRRLVKLGCCLFEDEI
jgi:hypothetical protein